MLFCNKNIFIYVILTFLLLPIKFAYASGDPTVLYWLGGWIILDIILFVIISIIERNKIKKIIKLVIYSLSIIVLWIWGMSVKGPDFNMSNFAMSISPVIITILLLII